MVPGQIGTATYFVGSKFAGTAADGRQVLMGLLFPYLVAYFFDPEGNPVGKELRVLPEAERRQHVDVFVPEYRERVVTELVKLQSELGFRPGTVHVRRFADALTGVEIRDRPECYEEFLRDPISVEPEDDDRRKVAADVEEWDRGDRFVLHWGNDYWMTAHGEIESS